MTLSDLESAQPGIDLAKYWDVVVVRWALIVVCAVLGGIAAVGYLAVVPRTYTASTTVSVFPITTDPYAANRNSGNLVDMTAEAVTASSFNVAGVAAKHLGGDWNAATLRNATEVTAGADNTTMVIAVSGASEKEARAGATAMAEAYLTARSDQATSSINTVLTRDRDRVQQYRDQLTAAIQRGAQERLGSLASAEAIASQQILNSQISALLSRTNQLEGVDTTGGVILNPASMTKIDVKPSTVLTIATGLGIGLLLGVVIAFATHSRRKTMRSARDLTRAMRVESLGSLVEDGSGDSQVASIAQRVLRLVAVNDAHVVALLFDHAVEWPTTFVDELRAHLRQSGVQVSVGLHSEAESEVCDLLIVPIEPGATDAARLQALRVSDVTILVVALGGTRIRSLSGLADATTEMGAPIVGAVLAPSMPHRAAKRSAGGVDTSQAHEATAEGSADRVTVAH